ncbi:MAG: PadR family transcriptional regulator [Butyricicoccus sp.]
MYYPVSSLLIECLILAVVEHEDSYGYEISQTVKLAADIKESTLYPILRRMEQNGYVTTYNQQFQGRNRKYYRMTDAGREQLVFLKQEWKRYQQVIDGIIEGGVRG